MKSTVKMPRVAETTDEVVVEAWLVEVGSTVKEGDPIMRVETDKVSVDVPAPIGGTLVEQLVSPEEVIVAGAGIAVFES
jgi:pyruvate/2-oxoglutarate dehydrogenase complex dihydrolipoamide acyltransferase (E2) component